MKKTFAFLILMVLCLRSFAAPILPNAFTTNSASQQSNVVVQALGFVPSSAPILSVLVTTNSVVSPTGAVSIASSTTAGIKEALATGLPIKIGPGTFNFSNVLYLNPGQSMTGCGTNTKLQWWGYVISSNNTIVGDDWVGIALATNVYLADFDVRVMKAASGLFSACIGRSTNAIGAANVLVERVSMHGDTDNFYIDNGGSFPNCTLANCSFESPWDVCALVSVGTNSSFTIINPKMKTAGTIAKLGGAAKSWPGTIATPIRTSGTFFFPVTVIGGTIESENVIASVSTGELNMFGTQIIGSGTNFLMGIVDTLAINTWGVKGAKLETVRPISAKIQGALNFRGFEPQSGLEGTAFDGSTGSEYYSTNSFGHREFNGITWVDWGFQYYSNKLEVLGASDSSYNGVYTFKARDVSVAIKTVWTNSTATRFLMTTTNTDVPDYGLAALSSTQSITDGGEFAGTDGPLRSGWDDTGITVRRVMIPPAFDGSAITNLPSSEVGVTDGSAAASGKVGEFINSLKASGSAQALQSTVPTNITTISLTAGDWDVEGNASFVGSTATVTATAAGIVTTANTIPTDGSEVYSGVTVTLVSETDGVTLPRKRVSVSSTTTVCLTGRCTFTAGSVSAFGSITARRAR